KEEIIYATLELASEYGLKSVSLSQIADKVGIKKPSLYNHFKSKEELVTSMYTFLREKAKLGVSITSRVDVFPEEKSLALILSDSISSYFSFLSDENMMKFFKVLYSERSISPVAAQIMLDETDRMILLTKNLFYALVVHGKMKNENVDTAALSYAMTVHSLVDRQMDMITAGHSDAPAIAELPKEIIEYIQWFCEKMEARGWKEN
ncbi:MAG: TetR/AcrR family transcriptional regulator, partial [Lachnospiraceae bacterium]|nr:TetR/AcrR family transcriptional regulator [Lachnospiraceae bacterium]